MTTITNQPFELKPLEIYSHKCALIMRMVDVAVRTSPEGWRKLVTTHGLNLTKEQAEQHIMRFDSGVIHVGGGWYEIILDENRQKSLGLFNIGGEWNTVYVAPKAGAL